jgi:glycosyltransferase involved in cell wall biosynthesis
MCDFVKTSIFCTNSHITLDSGGGVVCYNIIQALKSATNLKTVLCSSAIPLGVETECISPTAYQQPDSPFLYDYFASTKVQTKVDIAQFYGAPFAQTSQKLKPAKIIVDVAPHNIEVSREEHSRLGFSFPYPHLNDPELWKLYMLHVKNADVVVVHSKKSAEYLKQKLDLTNEVIVIPHGCNMQEPNPFPEKFDVAYLGRFGADKGLIYLIKAWSQLNLPESTLILAGANSEAMGDVLKLANARGKYHLIDYVESPQQIYSKCSVYIQPSVTEGFGIPCLEAMAEGRPVIVTEGAGASELVTNGHDGFVVPIRSPEAIAEHIMYFYGNREQLRLMGQKARKTAEQYTWDKIRKKYQELYVV